MDTPLSGERLTEERAFVKRYSEGLTSHKVEYQGDYSAPLGDRPRKVPVIQIPIADAPDVMDVDAPAQDTTITLTIKSLKPSLTISITSSLTDTVLDLKKQISISSNTAPGIDSQRLLLKGKALGDNKLLKEYDLESGSIVHLVIKPTITSSTSTSSTTAPTITESTSSKMASTPPQVSNTGRVPSPSTSPAPPSLTISTDVDDPSKPSIPQPLTITESYAPPTGPQPTISSASFHNTVSNPTFWQKLHALCEMEFEDEGDADAAWEIFLQGMKQRLSAGEAAKIRDVVGVRGMGGGA